MPVLSQPAAVLSVAVSPPAPAPPPPPPPPAPSYGVPATRSVSPPVPVSLPSSAAEPPRRRPVPAHQNRDDVVEERPIRVGKVQWPPPRVDDPRPEVQVGRLQIEENDASSMTSMRPHAEVVRERIHDRVGAARQNEPPPASTQPVCIVCLVPNPTTRTPDTDMLLCNTTNG